VPNAARLLRHLTGWVAALLLLCTPAHADGEYSPWRAFGLDEIRLGAMLPNAERRHYTGPGFSFHAEGGVDVNAEVLFVSPWSQFSNPFVDFLLRPRPMLGVEINTRGDTSQAYLGATWTLPLFDIFFVEATFGGSIHDGPLTSAPPVYRSAYGCRLNFHESGSAGLQLGANWRIMATAEHMSNGIFCQPNAGLTTYGARIGYKFN
jgi:hypothetical protein